MLLWSVVLLAAATVAAVLGFVQPAGPVATTLQMLCWALTAAYVVSLMIRPGEFADRG